MGPLHASEMRMYQACPRKWQHAYQSRRVPVRVSDALSVGTLVHAWLAQWWEGGSPPVPEWSPMAHALCMAYDARYARQPGSWRAEVKWESSVGGVDCAGTFDALQESPGSTVIVEHKTTRQDITPGSLYWRQVTTTDIQVSMYRAAKPGARILYDVVRKPALRKKDGESGRDFAWRGLEAMSERPEKYFQRAYVVRLESEDEAFARDIVSVDRLRRGKDHPRNAASCFAYGTRCEYFDVCFGADSLDGPEFTDQDESR